MNPDHTSSLSPSNAQSPSYFSKSAIIATSVLAVALTLSLAGILVLLTRRRAQARRYGDHIAELPHGRTSRYYKHEMGTGEELPFSQGGYDPNNYSPRAKSPPLPAVPGSTLSLQRQQSFPYELYCQS